MFNSTVYVSNLNGKNGFETIGVVDNSLSSESSVSRAGDINGDGIADVIIGVPYAGGRYGAGESYVIFGSGAGFGPALNVSSLDGNNGFVISGINANDLAGNSVSGAGDVNADGISDIIIGAPLVSTNGAFGVGASYVVFGNKQGFDAKFDLSALNGKNGFTISGANFNAQSGFSVSGAGDVNADGIADVIIGTSYESTSSITADIAYVVFGSKAGFSPQIKLSALDGANGFVISGNSRLGNFPVSGLEDVNGDGIDDVIIGASNHKSPLGYGVSYVIFGSKTGFNETFYLSALDGKTGFAINSDRFNDGSGYAVSGAGDVNDDGIADIIVGSQTASYVVFGDNNGFNATFSLPSLDGSNGFAISNPEVRDNYYSVSGAGDVNDDGIADVILGSKRYLSFVVFGNNGGFNSSLSLSTLDGSNGFAIDGSQLRSTGVCAVSGAGDVNDDGIADLTISTPAPDSMRSYTIFGENNRASFFAPRAEIPTKSFASLESTAATPMLQNR